MRRLLVLFLLLPGFLFSQSPVKSSYNPKFNPTLFSVFENSQEKRLFQHAQLKKSNNKKIDLLEAGLIASGAYNNQKISHHKKNYKLFFAKIKPLFKSHSYSPYKKARKILHLLFKHYLHRYNIERTTLIDALTHKKFNCVSATYLFNLTASKLGFKTRAIAVPGHVFSQVLLNNSWIDVETTSQKGFHPYRSRYAIRRGTGRYFIKDKGEGKIHLPLSNIRLTSLIFYNRGTILLTRHQPKKAAQLFLKALKIFPRHFESAENLLTAYIRWGKKLIAAGKTADALATCREAMTALGRRRPFLLLIENAYYDGAKRLANAGDFYQCITLLSKMPQDLPKKKQEAEKQIQGYYARWGQQLLRNNNYKKMMQIINKAPKRWNSRFIDSFKVHLATQAAQKIFRTTSPKQAINFYNKYIPIRNESNIAKNNRQFLYNRFGQLQLSSAKFEQAYLTFSDALRIYPGTRSFINNKLYTIQSWVRSVSKSTGNKEKIITVMYQMYQKYREAAFLKALVNNTVQEAYKLQKQGRYTDAEKILVRIAGLKPAVITARSSQALYLVFYNWGISYARKREYDSAITVFERALQYFPNDKKFQRYLKIFYYNLAIYFINTRQYTQARIIVQKGLKRFPKNQNLLRLLNHLTN